MHPCILSGNPPLTGPIECDRKMHVTSEARLKEAWQPLPWSLRILVLQMLPLKETGPLGNQQPCCEKPKSHVGRCSTQRSQPRHQACKGRDLFKGFVFLVNVLFCMWLLLWHFGLILRSDYFNWSWLKMAFGSILSGRDCFRWNFWFFNFWPIPLGAVLWRLAKKPKPSV